MADSIHMVATFEADAEVTKAADIGQWTIRGVFDDDEATVETGVNTVYLRTGATGTACMLRPEDARDLARCLNAAADKSETKTEKDER
jgi:hypothetical protein